MMGDRKEYFREYRRRNPQQYDPVKARARHLEKSYGISLEQYDAMLDAQGHRCALCLTHCGDKRLHVDHDHESGRVRGLLCLKCNAALGALGDSVESLERTLEYLKASPLALPLPDSCDSLLVQDLEVVAEAVEPGKDVT